MSPDFWHPVNCGCPQCEDARGRSNARGWIAGVSVVIVVMLAVVTALAWANPYLSIPVVSPVVCSFKGGTWYGGGPLAPPSCYPAGYPERTASWR